MNLITLFIVHHSLLLLLLLTVFFAANLAKNGSLGQKIASAAHGHAPWAWRRKNEGKRVLVSHIFATAMVHHNSYVFSAYYNVWKLNLDSGGGFCWCFCWRMCTKLGNFKGLGPLGGLLFKIFSYCSEVFVQGSYCCYVNTVNTNNTVAS